MPRPAKLFTLADPCSPPACAFCLLRRLRGPPSQVLVDELRIVFDKDTEAFVQELWAHLILQVLLADKLN